MEILVKASGRIVSAWTAMELQDELTAQFEKILNFEAAECVGEEGQAIANSVSRFCRRLPAYNLAGEDAMLVLRSIVDICEQWRKRQEQPA
jgi:hypothetical protein